MENASFWLEKANALDGWMKEIYHTLHMHPECKFEEIETNRILRRYLTDCGIPFLAPQENITIAVPDSGRPGACTGIRCDTDALPVTEATGLPFSSRNPGVMHACGHDGHMALGMACARMLHENKGAWTGRAKIIFQPAEEGADGSLQVIRTGLVSDCDVFFAIHLWSPLASGMLAASPKTVSAAVNMFKIRIKGRGGHGAMPESCRDAALCASAVTLALQQIVSRRLDPLTAGLVTIGSLHAGTTGNIIADSAVLEGTHRSLNEESRRILESALVETAQNTAAAYGCSAEVEDTRICGDVTNDPRAAAFANACAAELTDEKHIVPQKTVMLGDNFTDYGSIAPYVYAHVGIADAEKGTDRPHHAPDFRIDEDVLPLASAWAAAFAARAGEKWLTK